ncbi:hypothetical protein Y032_0127g1415 [Ancylostoma ceylanicum]|uniref:Uncharacterized protein n=1 Tax=Ancylostoma ceylanicum TaxID=53326 RepID=A0A016T8E4_9BILA|nr:hypothetical protein Y032_0127g1415 [Ancylostoma ceylanicum]
MARFFGWQYRQAGSGTRYYHPDYGHASRLGYNEPSNNSSTPPQSPQPTKDAESSTTFSPSQSIHEAVIQHYEASLSVQLSKLPGKSVEKFNLENLLGGKSS